MSAYKRAQMRLMDFKIMRRVFYRGPFPVKTSLSFSKAMNDALTELAKKHGYTVPELIYTVIDQYLIQEAEAKKIEWPKDFKPEKD